MMYTSLNRKHNKSLILCQLMNALGYSCEEIETRKLKSQYLDLCNDLFLPNKFLRYVNYAGSYYEGLEGNSITMNEIPTDMDDLNVKTFPEIYDSDINTCDCSCSIINCFDSHVHIRSDTRFPGYVRLYTKNIDLNGEISVPNVAMPKYIHLDDEYFDMERREFNGPACTRYFQRDPSASDALKDSPREYIKTLFYNKCPKEADEFLSRIRPNQWPSNEVMESIKLKGCNIAPVGHFDCPEQRLQWRIAFQGENHLFASLNHVQKLCYVIIKWILKIKIKPIAEGSLSSYHIKHIIFWSVQNIQYTWEPENLLFYLQMCLNQVKLCVSNQILPHFVISKRNLFNSKLTKTISKQIVCILEKYEKNVTDILELPIFEKMIKETNNDIEKLTYLTNESIIHAYFRTAWTILDRDLESHVSFHNIWNKYEGHDSAKSVQNYNHVLARLSLNKTVFASPLIIYVGSMIGMLDNSLYHETGIEKYQYFASAQYMKRNEHYWIPYFPIILRDVMYLYVNKAYKTIKEILVLPKFREMEKEHSITEYALHMRQIIHQQYSLIRDLCDNLTSNEMDNVKEDVKASFYCSTDSKCNKTVSLEGTRIVEAITHIAYQIPLFDYVSVVFMAAEKWGVAEVIQLELFSFFRMPQVPLSGIFMTSYLCWKMLAFLTNCKLGNSEDNISILSDMDKYLMRRAKEHRAHPNTIPSKDAALYEPAYLSYNIVAYCNRKADRNQQAMRYIIQSIKIFPSRRNSAWGYLKCIIMILRDILSEFD